MAENNKGPKSVVRAGTVTVKEWEQERTKDGKTFKVSNYVVERSYMDKDKKWQTTNSYSRDELGKLLVAVQEAYKNALLSAKDEQ